MRRPTIGIIACSKFIAPHPHYAAGEKYVAAVAGAAGGLPLLVPPLIEAIDLETLLDDLDGLFLTGSPSNVEPHRYGGPRSVPGTRHDPARDSLVFPLIRQALAAACPVFAVCRGVQELNVAFGGTLHQRVHGVPGMRDHREDKAAPIDIQYGPAHPVSLAAGGILARIAGRGEVTVNSVHSQGIDRLGPGLAVEARAPDGLIEAVRVDSAETFALGVQWHPEWRFAEDPFYAGLFHAFGEACRHRARTRGARLAAE